MISHPAVASLQGQGARSRVETGTGQSGPTGSQAHAPSGVGYMSAMFADSSRA